MYNFDETLMILIMFAYSQMCLHIFI